MKKLFIDMDGVLADFDGQPNALARFMIEKNFFKKLKPLPFVKTLNRALLSQAVQDNTYILSASPNSKADAAKLAWLEKHLPNMKPQNIILVRGGDKKAAYARADRVLVDDYSGNIKQWNEQGGVGVKFLNGNNGKSGSEGRKVATSNTQVWELFM